MSGAGENGAGTGGAMRWALLGSLAVNLFLLGAIVSHIAFRPPPPGRHDDRRRDFVERLLQDESSEEVKALAGQLREARREAWGGGREQSREAFEAMLAALRAESFDRRAYLDAVDARNQARNQARRAAAEAMADFAAKLSPERRSRLADIMEQRQQERAERWRRRRERERERQSQ